MAKLDTGKIIEHLKSKWAGRPCAMCGQGNWNVSESTYELREFNQGNLVIGGGPIIPLIPVTCSNCGNTILINAIVSGEVAAKKKE